MSHYNIYMGKGKKLLTGFAQLRFPQDTPSFLNTIINTIKKYNQRNTIGIYYNTSIYNYAGN